MGLDTLSLKCQWFKCGSDIFFYIRKFLQVAPSSTQSELEWSTLPPQNSTTAFHWCIDQASKTVTKGKVGELADVKIFQGCTETQEMWMSNWRRDSKLKSKKNTGVAKRIQRRMPGESSKETDILERQNLLLEGVTFILPSEGQKNGASEMLYGQRYIHGPQNVSNHCVSIILSR